MSSTPVWMVTLCPISCGRHQRVHREFAGVFSDQRTAEGATDGLLRTMAPVAIDQLGLGDCFQQCFPTVFFDKLRFFFREIRTLHDPAKETPAESDHASKVAPSERVGQAVVRPSRVVWVVFAYPREDQNDWIVIGIFSTKDRAVEVCVDKRFSTAPFRIDEFSPAIVASVPGLIRPSLAEPREGTDSNETLIRAAVEQHARFRLNSNSAHAHNSHGS